MSKPTVPKGCTRFLYALWINFGGGLSLLDIYAHKVSAQDAAAKYHPYPHKLIRYTRHDLRASTAGRRGRRG